MARNWLRSISRIMSESLKRTISQAQEILTSQTTNLVNDGNNVVKN